MGELSSDGALAGLGDWGSPEQHAHIRHLIDDNAPGVEEVILGTLDDAGPVRPLLCRVLAERDPDRDPDYALRHFYAETDGPVRRWLGQEVYRSPWMWLYGITRLRRAKPVERVTPDVTHWFATRRQIAVTALGDTADPAALPPVVGRLRDSKWWVRTQAAAAVRRLARSGVGVGSAAEPLAGCLHHDRQEVIEQAAAALALPVLRDRLLWSRATLMPLAGAIVDNALDGVVAPLVPLWPGEI
ncbi:HEAT repeat-containing protein [Lentzea xinjiangensis]|uniref:HEAT repeat-containing protein n=1 Tax=Lentzea xinjiangensis TaxID=402600 RepID=A0A1H9GAN9_9PSEU|nr:HEAT repeat domain-containing protein [Lentzea xinjiangensis]SEQ47167.1 HEAT repeat-containing protein [Lentzea xinjiangensis]